MDRLIRFSNYRVGELETEFRRYLYDEIDWKQRLIGILGSRGSGKTTLILQYLKSLGLKADEAIYMSLDDPYFHKSDLLNLAEDYIQKGGKHLFLDEVHKYDRWAPEIKTIHDTFKDVQIIFTGSSILELYRGDADLSRRASRYMLHGLSFREYLTLMTGRSYEVLSLDQVLTDHEHLAHKIAGKDKILKHFNDYIRHGYYPFFLDKGEDYHIALTNTINQILETDLMHAEKLRYESMHKLKKFLSVLGEMVPFTPNISSLSKKLQIARPTLYEYLNYLERSKLISLVYKNASGLKKMDKPDKIYLDNTNLAYSLTSSKPDKGALRETFFANQVKVKHKVTYGHPYDFLIDEKYAVEIGGKNKTAEQIKGKKDAFLIIDDVVSGYKNKIPLWLFGFLY